MKAEQTGLVLSGGGARGAYEAGVMSVLSPALDRRGERPKIYVGTSVGAINATLLAANRHLDAAEAARVSIDRWRDVSKGRVVRPILLRQVPLTIALYAGEVLSLPGVRLPSLLDPTPLRNSLQKWIDWKLLHRNVRDGTVAAVGTVATAARTGRTVVFIESQARKKLHRSHVID